MFAGETSLIPRWFRDHRKRQRRRALRTPMWINGHWFVELFSAAT